MISHAIRLFYYVDSLDSPEKETSLLENLLMDGSVYDLLKETAETIRTQTYADMRTVFDELQKKVSSCGFGLIAIQPVS